MAYLPLANILHHKLRSVLSALGVAIGICMLITLTGLSRGSLEEVADRWEAVDADLIVFPRVWGGDVANISAVSLPDKFAARLRDEHGSMVQSVVPVCLWSMKIAGQNQMVAGVDPDRFATLTGGRELTAGRMYDPQGRFARWVVNRVNEGPAEEGGVLEITPTELAGHGGLELVLDTRLAKAGNLSVGDPVEAAGHTWTIVGIVPAGGMARVYMPRRTAQWLFVDSAMERSTLLFVKLSPQTAPQQAVKAIGRSIHQKVMPVSGYRALLTDRFRIMYTYVDAVNVIALLIAFLFTMVILYTMVLQRTRDLAILKSSGASAAFLVRQVLGEAMLLALGGATVGIGMSFAADWAIERYTLLTVHISAQMVGVGVLAAVVGAVLSGIYPAWRACRVDMLSALAME